MILILLVLIAVLFFIGWNVFNSQPLHFILSTIFSILLAATMLLSVANFKYHYGMHKVTTTEITKNVKSLSSSLNMVVSQPVGTSTSTDRAVVYKAGTQKATLKPDTDVKNLVVKRSSVKQAKLVTKTTRWEYKSSFYRFMFGLAQKSSVAHTEHKLYVPTDWLVLNQKQIKALPTVMKREQTKMQKASAATAAQQQAAMQQQAQAYVKQQLALAEKEDPKMDAKQQQAVVKQATADAKKKLQAKAKAAALKKLIPKVQAELDQVK